METIVKNIFFFSGYDNAYWDHSARWIRYGHKKINKIMQIFVKEKFGIRHNLLGLLAALQMV